MQITVVIPTFNEERVIAKTLTEVKEYLSKSFESWEIIVVDDCSTDRTLEILQDIDDLKILGSVKNHGKGYSVAKGVQQAKSDWILFMDADSSTKITELSKFLPYTKDHQLIVGSRALAESDVQVRQNIAKVFLGKAGNLFSRLILGISIKDTQCGFKFFSKELKEVFAKLTIDRWAFDFELIYLANKAGFRIKEVPVIWVNDFDSKVKWYSYPQTLWQVIKIRFKKYN